jgi:hypothetical protein
MKILRAVSSVAIVIVVSAMLTSCSESSNSPTPANPTVTVASVVVTGTAPSVGSTAQFSATATLSNGTTQIVTAQATWSSSSTAMATVTSAGVVAGLAAGDTDVTATYQGVSGRVHVTIARSAASTYRIAGTVTDATSGGILPNINIQAADSAGNTPSTKTDGAGAYAIGGLAPGSITVTASATSYQTTKLNVSVSSDTRVDVVLPRTACVFTLSGTAFSFGASGGTATVTVTSQTTGCAWAAVSNDAFVTIASGANGTDNGTVTIAVGANTGALRLGTVVIAGQPVAVFQGRSRDGCQTSKTVSLTAATQEFLSDVGSECTLGVSGSTAIDVPWIRLVSTMGGGQFLFLHVDANPGAARTGHVTLLDGGVVYAQLTFNQSAGVTAISQIRYAAPRDLAATVASSSRVLRTCTQTHKESTVAPMPVAASGCHSNVDRYGAEYTPPVIARNGPGAVKYA